MSTKVKVSEKDYLAAKIRGLSKNIVDSRLNSGNYTLEEALTLPVGKRRKAKKHADVFSEAQLKEASFNNIAHVVALNRYKSGKYTKEEAVSIPVHGKKEYFAKKENFKVVDVMRGTRTKKCNLCGTEFKGRHLCDYIPLKRKLSSTLQKVSLYEKKMNEFEDSIDKLMEALDYYAAKEDGQVAKEALESIN